MIRVLIITAFLVAALRVPMAAVHGADPLYTIRMCESNDNYTAVSDNGLYYGAYQFSLPTWRAVGGVGLPHHATPQEQDYRAWLLLTEYGAHHWPVCGKGVTGYETR